MYEHETTVFQGYRIDLKTPVFFPWEKKSKEEKMLVGEKHTSNSTQAGLAKKRTLTSLG